VATEASQIFADTEALIVTGYREPGVRSHGHAPDGL